jgi:hypothetical protein
VVQLVAERGVVDEMEREPDRRVAPDHLRFDRARARARVRILGNA